jgi:hypothetical protein
MLRRKIQRREEGSIQEEGGEKKESKDGSGEEERRDRGRTGQARVSKWEVTALRGTAVNETINWSERVEGEKERTNHMHQLLIGDSDDSVPVLVVRLEAFRELLDSNTAADEAVYGRKRLGGVSQMETTKGETNRS